MIYYLAEMNFYEIAYKIDDINDASALAYLFGTVLHVSQIYFRSGKLMLQVKPILSILDRSCLNTDLVRLFVQPRRCHLDLRRDF